MERCQLCQGEIDPATDRCCQCGRSKMTGVAETEATIQKDGMISCLYCQAQLPLQARFCGTCGRSLGSTSLQAVVSPQSSAELIPAAPIALVGTVVPSSEPHSQQHAVRLHEQPLLPESSLPPSPLPGEWTHGGGIQYLDFEMQIGPHDGNAYQVSVLHSPVGEAHGTFNLPFKDTLTEYLQSLQEAAMPPTSGVHQPFTARQQTIQRFGQTLFVALMAGEIRSLYDASRQHAYEHGKGLRLKLHIQSPELAIVPWEYLYDARQGDFLSLSRSTPLVRYLDVPQPPQPLKVRLPLRILVLMASPSDQETLDVAGEQRRLYNALQGLEAQQAVEITYLQEHTERALQRTLQDGPWHVFHFIGHGGFDEQSGEGVLALENEARRTHLITATQLGRLLGDQHSLRLVVLNACEGARGNRYDLFSSTASTLVRRGIPAILAMQAEMSDAAAMTLARWFYQGLADGLPVDTAVAEARKAMSVGDKESLEWGTPVLYLRSPDGRIFDLPRRKPGPPRAPEETEDYWLKAGMRYLKGKHYDDALVAFARAIQIAPLDAVAYQHKGDALKHLNQLPEALEAYEQALNLDPGAATAAFGKAEVLRRLKRIEEAVSAEVRAMQLVKFRHRRLIYQLAKFWVRGLAGVASFFELSILSILMGFTVPVSPPLLVLIRANAVVALLIGGGLVAITILSWFLSRGPEPTVPGSKGNLPFSRRLLLSNLAATSSTTLFVLLLATVLIRPPWCPTALCPAPVVLTHGYHDNNLELDVLAIQSAYSVIPGELSQYSLQHLPPGNVSAVLVGPQTTTLPYRVAIKAHSLAQGRYSIIIEQVALVVQPVPSIPYPLNVWYQGEPLDYNSTPYLLNYLQALSTQGLQQETSCCLGTIWAA
jgi:tetratricopeptide (TPR) repeat protein